MKNVTKRFEAKAIMDRSFSIGLVLFAALSVVSCKEDILGGGPGSRNVLSFTVGNAGRDTKSGVSPEYSETQVATYALDEIDGEQLSLVETVSSIESLYGEETGETKGTPVYTENFDSLYGTKVYATAFEPKTGDATSYVANDVWGSYLENGGTVNFKLDPSNAHTYYYDYSKGQAVNLAWPEGGSLLYFIQAPYEKTNALNPVFYSDGSIQFDYTDPTSPTDVSGRQTIVNGAASQTDILFTSKVVNQPAKGNSNNHNILMYHALTAVKFKAGIIDAPAGVYATNISTNQYSIRTEIKKVTIKGLRANGHCTISPNYTDANTTAGANPSNKDGDTGSKSAVCSTWTFPEEGALVVDYSQTFGGTVDYNASNSDFAQSFYDGTSNLNNLGTTTDGSEILLFIPQEKGQVEFVVDFTLTSGSVVKEYQRSVKVDVNWKAGELRTYELTINKVDVDIEDTMNNIKTVKEGVIMKNTGNVTAYLRASYAIAWYYGYGDDATIVAAYQGHGHFVGLPGTNWIEGEDGYFYYKYPIKPDQSSDFPLFTKFTAPTKSEEAPFPGAHLEVKLLLQGVQYDIDKVKVMAAWGNVKVKGSGVYVVDQLDFIPENYGI